MADEGKLRAELCAALKRFARGMTDDQAGEVLDLILKGWGFPACAHLVAVLPAVEVPGQLSASGVLFWLHATVLVGQRPIGRKLLAEAGKMSALIDAEPSGPTQ